MAVAPVLVLAIGNPSRGDDAIGPLLAERLVDHLAQRGPAAESTIEVIVDQQLVVEHVLDLVGRSRVLFIDAAAQGAESVSLTGVEPAALRNVLSHSVSPGVLLRLFSEHLGSAPPPAELLAVAGEAFELGAPLSSGASDRLKQAWLLLQAWAASALPGPAQA